VAQPMERRDVVRIARKGLLIQKSRHRRGCPLRCL